MYSRPTNFSFLLTLIYAAGKCAGHMGGGSTGKKKHEGPGEVETNRRGKFRAMSTHEILKHWSIAPIAAEVRVRRISWY